jgi:DNA invertase Pin-like site-specific DNA recombinase
MTKTVQVSAPSIPAAEYVRMSTEDQQYSIANQQTEIQKYAAKYGFIVRHTYTDAGKSGVVIKHRKGLAALIQDVVSGKADFRVILVYDVSRWGRFQNPDEAAHYEYLCNEAGIRIHYCAEQFANDGSLPSSIMKALKRTMAGEYSRELGIKVYEGKKRLTELGFRQGGTELYGLRRMVVSADGRRKHLLKAGERKSILSDRVILVHGDKRQVAIVKEIFQMAAFGKKSLRRIAALLNERKVKTVSGRLWLSCTVYKLLKNPAYMGCAVWGRSSKKMHGASKIIPRIDWIVKKGAFAPVVDEATFERAQKVIEGRNRLHSKSNEEIVENLKRVLSREGRLSEAIIRRSRGLLKPRVLYNRFGSFLKLYALVGYTPPTKMVKVYMNRQRAWTLRKDLLKELVKLSFESAKVVQLARHRRRVLEIGQDRYISVYLCRRFLSKGNVRWKLEIAPEEINNDALICYLNAKAEKIVSYHLVGALKEQTFECKDLRKNDPWLAVRGVKIRELAEVFDRLRDDKRFSRPVLNVEIPKVPLAS